MEKFKTYKAITPEDYMNLVITIDYPVERLKKIMVKGTKFEEVE